MFTFSSEHKSFNDIDFWQFPLTYQVKYMDQISGDVEGHLPPQFHLTHLNPKKPQEKYQYMKGVLWWNLLFTSILYKLLEVLFVNELVEKDLI